MATLWHLAEPHHWRAAQACGSYTGSTRDRTLADVGFVHCSSPTQLPSVVEALYGDVVGEFVILELDSRALHSAGSPVREEPADPTDANSPLFPHVYGPIPTAAVTKVIPARIDRGRLHIDDDDARA